MSVRRALGAQALAAASAALIAIECCAQQAPEEAGMQVWLNPGSLSYHFDRDKDLRGKNIGLGAELMLAEDHALAAGTFINSDRKRSHYGAYVWRPLHWQFTDVKVHVGVAVGGFDGYPNYHHGGWFPAALPVLALEGDRIGVNVFFVPTIANRTNGAISFQFKLRVW